MQGKIMLVLGGAVGYVIGTRAGRQGYERLKRQAAGLWHNHRVQERIAGAGDYAKENIPVIGGTLQSAVARLASAGVDAATNKHVASPSTPAVAPSPAPMTAPSPEPTPEPTAPPTEPPTATPTVDVVAGEPQPAPDADQGEEPNSETPEESGSPESGTQASTTSAQPQQASNNG